MQSREIVLDPDQAADIAKFEAVLTDYLAGDIGEDAFRVFRLTNGIYGQRQGGRDQMVRVRIPYGRIEPHQLEMMGHIAEHYSRGWGHITTRQNIQFHFVQLERIPDLMRDLASVGMTSREACGDTNRNVQGCHLAGACPFEVLDITAWAEAANRHFLRNPLVQRLPRKFKINFSGCDTDCGQAMFNDCGVIAVHRPREDGSLEAGFRVFVAGGLGANPHPALALEEFTPRDELLATLESVLRVFANHGNRDNKLRARMKWLIDTMGWDEVRERILKERTFLIASSTWPGGVPEVVDKWGDSPAGTAVGTAPTPVGQGTPVVLRRPPAAPGAPTSGGRTPTSYAATPRARCRPTPGPASATSPPSSSAPWPASSASSAPRCASRTARTSCSATSPRSSCRRCSTGSPSSAWPNRAPSWRVTWSPAPVPTPATSP